MFFMRCIAYFCLFVNSASYCINNEDDINGEIIKVNAGNKKSCNCKKDKTDNDKKIESNYAENASKVISNSFLNLSHNKGFIEECFPNRQNEVTSIDELYKLNQH